MKALLTIWKIGGRVIDRPQELQKVLEAFALLPHPKILVHGGGSQATELSNKLGLATQLVQGRRLTDAPTLEVVTMVYAGLINKTLVAGLQAKGVNALGLTGADANTILAHKRQSTEIDYGFAGDIADHSQQYPGSLELFLNAGLVPVFCALTHDGKGQLLNTNADTIASHLGQQLCGDFRVNLVFCFDRPGVLSDARDPRSLIKELTQERYEKLKREGHILDGMVPKLDNAFAALKAGVHSIYLCDWKSIIESGIPKEGTKLCMK